MESYLHLNARPDGYDKMRLQNEPLNQCAWKQQLVAVAFIGT